MALPTEVYQRYKNIIDEILSQSDLSQVTEKRIRNGIQDRVEYDITPQKAAIKELILHRFDIFNARQNGQPDPVPSIEVADPVPATNGHKRSASASASEENVSKRRADDSDVSDVIDHVPPKKKKMKKEESVDDDAAFAAKLQAEEDRAARSTRGAGSRKAAPSKGKKQKKALKKSRVTASDDSEVEDGASPRKVNRNTGFHKPMNLSPVAAEFFGSPQLSRPQVTSEIWKYIKSHDLQDPSDKRYILCDDKLRVLLKQDKVHMFQMTKILNTHMYNPEE